MSGYVPRPNPLAFLNLPQPDEQPQGRQNLLTPPWAYANNPVGTETTQGVGMPQGPFNQVQWVRPDGTPVTAGDMAQAHGQVQQAMELAPTIALGMLGDAPGIKAYHGSPYSFDAFDASKIGTGEGAQAFGHGLYFADAESTARSYRDRLANGRLTIDGQPTLPTTPAQNLVVAHGGDVDAAIKSFGDRVADWTPGQQARIRAQDTLDELAALRGRTSFVSGPGSMYEVNIAADPAHFLDWDKPLSEQSDHVVNAVADLAAAKGLKLGNATGARAYHALAEHLAAPPPPPAPDPGGWASVPGGPVDMQGRDPAAAAAALRQAGIPGIRYLDAGSRAAGQGTSNHVVFDPATIEILRKYGIAGLGLGLGAAATQQGNGQ
jgi:hypothetical protein